MMVMQQARGRRGVRPITRATTFWTRERVMNGLFLFYKQYGVAPTNTHEYHKMVKGTGIEANRIFPSFYGVLRYFATFREAWTAIGVVVNRSHEEWSELEEWYLREAAGILSRNQIALDLRRSADAVHRRLYDLNLNTRNHWGWTLNRASQALKIDNTKLRAHIKRGDLPCFLGNWFIYIDPGDLVGLAGIDWRRASGEIKEAAKKSLIERIVKIVAGVDWRAGRIYQVQPNFKHRPSVQTTGPKPKYLKRGNVVEVIATFASRPISIGRRGRVLSVQHSRNCWRARVEFEKEKPHGSNRRRVVYSIPLVALKKVKLNRRRG
jgi:hypothetical protein